MKGYLVRPCAKSLPGDTDGITLVRGNSWAFNGSRKSSLTGPPVEQRLGSEIGIVLLMGAYF